MLEWMKTNLGAARTAISNEVTKFKNREFMEAVVAGCALVASADGDISSQEKQKMIGYMKTSDELKVFDTGETIAFFGKCIEKFEFDASIGEAEALKVIGRLRTKTEAARTLIRVCCVIGASDGNFDADERKMVSKMCSELNLSPADFDL